MTGNDLQRDSTPSNSSSNASAGALPTPEPAQAKPQTLLLVPRRIDVMKQHHTPDSFLRMEIDDTTIYMVPIGPKLVSALIEGLERTQRFVASPTSSKQ